MNKTKGGALYFSGENHYTVEPGNFENWDSGALEVEFSYYNKSQRTLFSSSSTTSTAQNFSLSVANGHVLFYDRLNSILLKTTKQLVPGLYYSLIVNYDRGKILFYIDGKLQQTTITYQGNSKKIGWFSDVLKNQKKAYFTLGAFKRPKQTKNHFTGYLKKFKLYDKTIVPNKIKDSNKAVIDYHFDLTNCPLDVYIKSIFRGGYINSAIDDNQKIMFSEITKETLLLHLVSLVSLLVLVLLIIFMYKGEPLFLLPKNYIKGFDGLRGISILLVIVTHLGWLESLDTLGQGGKKMQFLFSGTTGVNIFFTLSGFLITNILLRELKKGGKVNFKAFYTKRVLRLFPPLLVFLLIILILMLSNILSINYSGLLYSFFYVYNFIPKSLSSAELGLTWSLSVEEQFYLFFPITLFLIRKRKHLLLLLFSLITICGLLQIIHLIDPLKQLDYVNKYIALSEGYYTNRWILPAIATILMGCVSGILVNENTLNRKISQKPNLIFGISLTLMFCFLYLPEKLIMLGWIIQSAGTCLLILYIVNNQNSYIVRKLEFQPLSAMGKISYGLYIYQGLFLTTGPKPDGPLFQKYPLNILLVFIFAILSYRYLEKPFLKLKGKLVKR
ncbi:acyltransferase [Cytophaga sp. FL35]|nr:acyltransferase [Cytophaga sp. FL35]